jgi:hypothetical protein
MTTEDGSVGNVAGPSRLRPYLSVPEDEPGWAESPDPDADGPASPTAARLPPYLMTGGRARPINEGLELEAQVVATGAGRGDMAQLSFESRDIVALCGQPLAVAEIAGRLGLQIGVTRVLVSDLVTTGHLAVRRPQLDAASQVDVIERVIRGLQEIP